MIIKSLPKEKLIETIALGERVFSRDDPARIVSSIEKSLQADKEKMLKEYGVANIQYWIAEENNQVIGAIGYYLLPEDADEAAWMGWFFVHPEYRGRKIGLQLLETVIDAVKKARKTYLRVYFSSEDPQEKRAYQIYALRGFIPFREPGYHAFQK